MILLTLNLDVLKCQLVAAAGWRDNPSVGSLVRHDRYWEECQESETGLLNIRSPDFLPGGGERNTSPEKCSVIPLPRLKKKTKTKNE